MIKITILSMLLGISLFSLLSCTPTVSQQGHDVLRNELSKTQSELSTARSELSTTRSELSITESELNETQRELIGTQSELSKTQSELSATQRELTSLESKLAEADVMQAQYKELSTKYEELKKQYDAVIEGTAEIYTEINEGDVEQVLFELVNQERKNNGLSVLIWNKGLYSCAQTNNLNMAETHTLQKPECPSFQQVFWFLGYGTTDRIANIALKAWKDNLYSYRQNVLNKAVYGAVAVYKSEEILYITYISYIDFNK